MSLFMDFCIDVKLFFCFPLKMAQQKFEWLMAMPVNVEWFVLKRCSVKTFDLTFGLP